MPDAPTDEIAQLRQQLQAMQAMATLGELTGTATHEFNNMLMTVINYAKMGLRNPDDATREKALTRILDVSQRAAKITATILAQARNRGDAFVPTDLAEIIRDAMILLEREMRKYRITVELELPEALPRALANGNQLQRVLLNLMINARQAMPEGGTLAIRLKHDEASGQLVLTVRDFGCGIAAEALPQIFEPFFTTKAGPDEIELVFTDNSSIDRSSIGADDFTVSAVNVSNVSVESTADVRTLRQRAVEAVESARERGTYPHLNRWELSDAASIVRYADDRLGRLRDEEPIDADSITREVGDYVQAAAVARAVPETSGDVASLVRRSV